MSNIFHSPAQQTATQAHYCMHSAAEPCKAMQEMMDTLNELRFVSEQENEALREYQTSLLALFGNKPARQ